MKTEDPGAQASRATIVHSGQRPGWDGRQLDHQVYGLASPIYVKYQWTADELIKAQEHYAHRACRPAFHVYDSIYILTLGCVGLLTSGAHPIAVFMVLVGLHSLFGSPLTRWGTRRRFARRLDRDLEIEWWFSEDWLHTRTARAGSNLSKSESSWDLVSTACRAADGFLILGSERNIYHWIPDHAFENTEDVVRLQELLKQKVKEYEVIGD